MVEWRQVDWLPDYEISENGEVRRATKGRTRPLGHMVKPFPSRVYLRYKLMMPDGSKKKFSAHRLVCEAFHGPPPSPEHQAAHGKDGPANNHYSNLRWATPADNYADLRRAQTLCGEGNGRAVLTEAQVLAIRAVFDGSVGQVAKLAAKFGMSKTAIHDICSGKRWRHLNAKSTSELAL